MNALVYLLATTFVGRARRAIRLLRTPRYAVGFVLGFAYLAVFLYGPLVASRTSDAAAPFRGAEVARTARHLAGAVLGIMLVLQCATAEVGLAFRDGELAFLQAAPLPRRWLVAYRLLDGQAATVRAGLVFGIVATLSPGGSAWSVLGTLVAVELLALVRTYCSLAAGSLRERGRSTAWLKVLPLGVIFGLLLALALSARALERAGTPAWRGGRAVDPAAVLERLARVDPLRTALRPFDVLGTLLFPGSPAEIACACGYAAALGVALVAGCFASRARFVPASLAQSRRVAAIAHAERALPEPALGVPSAPRRSWARDYAPFALAPRGADFAAFAWLALIAAGPRLGPRRLAAWLVAAAAVGLAAGACVPGPAQLLVGIFALQIAFTAAAVGGQRMASDLIGQPARLAVLKAMPVTGRAIVMGEVLANTLVQSSLTLAGWTFAAGVIREVDGVALPLASRGAGWLAGVGLIVALALLVHAATRALALFLPGWFRSGGLPAQGMAAFGQNLLVLLARVLVVTVACVPAGLGGGAAAVLALAILGKGELGVAVAILGAGVVASAVFALAAWGAAWVAGEVAYPRCRPAELA